MRPSRNALSGSMIEKFSTSLPVSVKTSTDRDDSAVQSDREVQHGCPIRGVDEVPVSCAGRKSELR